MKTITKLFSALLLLLFSFTEGHAITLYWVANQPGNFSDAANWNTAANGSGSSAVPTSSDDLIVSRNANIIFDGNFTVRSFVVTGMSQVVFETSSSFNSPILKIGGGSVSPAFLVNDASELDVTGEAIKITLVSGSQCEIRGTMDITGNHSFMEHPAGTTTTVKSMGIIRYGGTSGDGIAETSSLIMENYSLYEIAKDGGVFPKGTFAPLSEFRNSGASTMPAHFAMETTEGSYGLYVFNSQSFNPGNSNVAINSNVTVQDVRLENTGSGRLIFSSDASVEYTLTVNGRFQVDPRAIFEINSAGPGSQPTVVKIFGDADIQGTVTALGGNTGSVIEMAGPVDANWSSSANALQNDVSITIVKDLGVSVIAATDIIMPLSPNSILSLNNGIIDMKTNSVKLVVQNADVNAINGGSVSSHITGNLVRFTNQTGDYSFPVSNTNDEMAMAVLHSNSPEPNFWNVAFATPNANVASGLTPGKIDEIGEVNDYAWVISRDGTGTSNVSDITFYYSDLNQANQGFAGAANTKVAYFDGSLWSNLGALSGATGNITNSIAIPNDVAGMFSIGRPTTILPINVEYFTGRRSGTVNELTWKLNCTGGSSYNMSLQRSGDGTAYTDIYSENVDEVRCLESFSFRDEMPLTGKNYYRLALTDLDGRVIYSQIVLLAKSVSGTTLIRLYPNPAFGTTVTAEVLAENAMGAEILMTDILGRVVKRVQPKLMPATNKVQLDVDGLPTGSYNIILHDAAGNKSVLPLIKQ